MKHHLSFDDFLKDSLKNPKIKAEYDKLQPEFALIDALIKSRAKNNMTQRQLANKMGTKQSVISRLEIGRANPTLSFLKRLAKALNSKLEIRFSQ
ncbi:transcriptional regulator [Candidatus Roizmanbacteria bacterium CG22_combo_CG10-13_8_21_14_all_34_12]|uniref:Transcriptional regulator n=1 Tax=Candidatus Roizmanbacteria bacterium CG22_combo_CG10-13_8_21_14_all_34_12 TaxID=1974860 RepID=A0A2H0C3E1_9BACT|nr:MAG: transcriptional regulator [Candidatus Roizmanbacteria bacterium CG22_combo_CG10-13_8_21_14_all_34_12]